MSEHVAQQPVDEATEAGYQAKYYHQERNVIPGSYLVHFHSGHTVAKHFTFLGRKFDLTTLNHSYFANLDDKLFVAVRSDPGVEFIEDDGFDDKLLVAVRSDPCVEFIEDDICGSFDLQPDGQAMETYRHDHTTDDCRAGVLLPLCALSAIVGALNPIQVKQQQFTDSGTNARFVVVGIDYQPGGQGAYGASNSHDPLSNATACLRDAALMQDLGINTIRSYNVDPTLNHDECASIFNSVGIYMLIDVNSPLSGQSLDRSDPSGSYTTSYLQHIFSVVEAFKSYPNVLGFFAGNEVINDNSTSKANPPYIRAVQRDLKQYIKNHASRTIPVGYSAADVREVLQDTWAYLQCSNVNGTGTDTSRSDFFGLNSYSWCGSASSFTTSGYNDLVAMFGSTTIPVFFSEFGCNKPLPRVFDEVPTLYGPQMTVLSGGLVYEWTQESDKFGLAQVNPDGSINLLSDFNTLQSQYNKLNITLLQTSNTTATNLQPPQCNSSLISGNGFSTDFNLPPPPQGAEQLISSGVSNAPSGSLVPVTQTSVQVSVYQTNGALVTGLTISAASGANTPGGHGLSSATATATGAAASASHSSPAYRIDAGVAGSAVAAGALGILAFVL